MIRYRRDSVAPPHWLVGANQEMANDELLRERYQEAEDNNMRGITWRTSDENLWKDCKPLLGEISHWKCPYCDTRNISNGDVEHFRPKNKKMYWWLALTWENLLLACPICNRYLKRGKFPLGPGGVRAQRPGHSLAGENHLLINPLDENPEPMTAYSISGDKVMIEPNSSANQTDRGRVQGCIKFFKLNERYLIHNTRRKVRRDFARWFFVHSHSSSMPAIYNQSEDALRDLTSDEAECAGMARQFLREKGLGHLIP